MSKSLLFLALPSSHKITRCAANNWRKHCASYPCGIFGYLWEKAEFRTGEIISIIPMDKTWNEKGDVKAI